MPDPSAERDEFALGIVAIACDLAVRVRDEGPDAVSAVVSTLTAEQLHALPAVMAAMIPDDRSANDLLAWAYAPPELRRTSRRRRPCGTRAGYAWHRAQGEDPCDPCALAERLYSRERKRAKAAAKQPKDDTSADMPATEPDPQKAA